MNISHWQENSYYDSKLLFKKKGVISLNVRYARISLVMNTEERMYTIG